MKDITKYSYTFYFVTEDTDELHSLGSGTLCCNNTDFIASEALRYIVQDYEPYWHTKVRFLLVLKNEKQTHMILTDRIYNMQEVLDIFEFNPTLYNIVADIYKDFIS